MKMRKRTQLWGIPLLTVFLLAHIVPLISAVMYSFMNNTFDRRFSGFANYAVMLYNRYFRLAIINTARFALTGVPVALLVSLTIACLFHDTGRGISRGWVFIMPALLPSAAAAVIFGNLADVGRLSGVFTKGSAQELSLLLIFVWKNTGLLFLILFSAMCVIPGSIYEAAEIDGAGRMRRLVSITLPNIASELVFAAIYAVMHSFAIYKESYLMFGSYPADNVYMLQHYMNNHFDKLEFQFVAAAGTFFALVCFILALAGDIAGKRLEE